MKYYKFFNVCELFKNCTSAEISVCCCSHCIDSLLVLLQVIDDFREFADTPIRITSSYRDAEHNKRVGGVSTSQHLLGQAIDFQPVSMPFETFQYMFREFLQKSLLERFVGQVIIYKTFIHIGLRTPSHKNLVIYDKRNNQNNH